MAIEIPIKNNTWQGATKGEGAHVNLSFSDSFKMLFRGACLASAMVFYAATSTAPLMGQTYPSSGNQSALSSNGSVGAKPTWKDVTMVAKPATYDQIFAASISKNLKTIEYTVSAVPQSDKYGYGAGYFVSGLTKSDHWYQVALVYDWPGHNPSHAYYFKGFYMSFNCFHIDNSGNKHGIVGMRKFTHAVNAGDKVDIKLSFSNGNVIMSAYDINTHGTASVAFKSNDTAFIGTKDFVSPFGFFTGIITERYGTTASFGSLNPVTYYPVPKFNSAAYIFEMEYDPNGNELFRSSIIHLTGPYNKKYTYKFKRGNETYQLEYGPFGEFATKSTMRKHP